MLGADGVCIPLMMYTALSLKADNILTLSGPIERVLLLSAVVSIPIFARLGLYRAVVRFMGPRAAMAVAMGVGMSVALLQLLAVSGLFAIEDKSTIVIFGSLLLTYVGASRMLLRWIVTAQIGAPRTRVIVYGAGQAGAELATGLLSSPDFSPVAFVDDSVARQGTIVAGVRVHDPAQLPKLVDEFGVRRILLAMPALSRRRRREILTQLEPLGVHIQTMPKFSDLVSGVARVSDVQDVDVGDLLGRDAVPPNQKLLSACIRGKVVMVTGAGGSIGAELCRQIIVLEPTRLLLFEISEVALYTAERELRQIVESAKLSVDLVALLGNAHHKSRVREILQSFGVQTIYHAAAYKHVPIVEHNIVEGLQNNLISSWQTAEAAIESRVETFVLISTDKAVNPTNVMGATKRFAEIVLQGLQQRTATTRFCMVRFGNVLESSGSVVPLFRDQISRNGPVTVTHADVIRYFMTIPEAAQLVVQAGSMAEGGDVFVLDMGKPVRILELARRMIHLSGYSVRDQANPDGDIEIRFTGLRPGEKLFEELLIGKNVTGTEHPMIMRAVEPALTWAEISGLLDELDVAMRRFDCSSALSILQRAVREYQPQSEIQDIVWTRRSEVPATAHAELEAKVADLQVRRPFRLSGQAGAATHAE